jgi:predicted secreted protein
MTRLSFIPRLLSLLLLASPHAHAGDWAELNFIGFSKDGRYLAFEEHGTQDGSGFPYSNYFFIDARDNSFAALPAKVVIESEAGGEARAEARRKAEPLLKKLGIVEGNRGDAIMMRLPTDLSGRVTTKNGPITINFARRLLAENIVQGNYELTLTPLAANDKGCEGLGEPIQMLQVELKNIASGTSKLLQKDEALPKSRRCPVYYGLNSLYWNGGTLAAFIAIHSVGFEGHDTRFMAVTGMEPDPDLGSSAGAPP